MSQKYACFSGDRLRRLAVLGWILLLLAACSPAAAAPNATNPPAPAPSRIPTTATATRAFEPRPTSAATSTQAAPTKIFQTATSLVTGSPPASTPVASVTVPILLYHHVSDRINTRYSIPVKTFRRQMEYLYENGYETVSISTLANVLRGGGSLPEKAVVLTFDDGYLDTFENAYPILKEFGFTGVVYIITQTLEKEKSYGYMQAPALKELSAAGWEIGSHSVTHSDLKKTSFGIGNEMKQSKQTLEKLLGVPVRSFSYPYGIANDWIKDQARENGYESAVGVDILVTNTPRRLYYLSRREVPRSSTMREFQNLLVPGDLERAAVPSPDPTQAAP